MQVQARISTYREALESSLKYINFDRSSNEIFDFEELYYPLKIDEGKYAFQSYANQMARAKIRKKEKSLAGNQSAKDTANEFIRTIERLQTSRAFSVSQDDIVQDEHENEDKFTENDNESTKAQLLRKINRINSIQNERISAKLGGTSVNGYVDNDDRIESTDASDESLVYSNKELVRGINDRIGDNNKAGSHRELKDMDNQQIKDASALASSALDEGQDEQYIETTDLLESENQYDHGSLIVSGSAESRILAVASAGHGKTTLLRRIALYYCHPNSKNEKHKKVKDVYSLSGDYVPCLIQLRDVTERDFLIDEAIENSIISVFKNSEKNDEFDAPTEISIKNWIDASRDKLILLIDGLDELSDGMRLRFLLALEDYISRNPNTPVIMTSRVAGLSEPQVKEALQRMRFRGRSIMPLTKEESKQYSEQWINATQPVEQRNQLMSVLEQISSQSKYKYLMDFMRTPLDLLLILRRIASESLSSNRFQMFHDTLWEYFTSHVQEYDQRRLIFEDTMTFLSFIAYHMQVNDSMYISIQELEELSEELNHLSFHTDLIKSGTPEDYRGVLDSIAANVGIIERDDRTSDIVYTFPIRVYQEFLVSHACCHLRLNPELSKPDPYGILCRYLSDSRWISIINFALSDLETNNQQEFDAIVNLVFTEVDDIERLRSVVESDLAITIEHALVLCDNVFSSQAMTEQQEELLVACMTTKSAYAYVYALNRLYQSAASDNMGIEACALSSIIWEYSSGRSAYQKAFSYIQSGSRVQTKLGAEMISIMSRTIMDETAAAYKDKIKEDFNLSEKLLVSLDNNASLNRDVFSITALTNIWLSKVEGSKKVKRLLDAEMASIVIDELNDSKSIIHRLCIAGANVTDSSDYKRIQELVFTLGSIPLQADNESLLEHGQGDILISIFFETLYRKSKEDFDIDQVAISMACLYYCWNINQFMEAWTSEICKGMPSEYVRKVYCSIREKNHFELVRKDLEHFEHEYQSSHQNDLNSFNTQSSVFSLFRSGDILAAAKYCIKTLGRSANSNKTNLAFLIRYGHLRQEDLETQTEYTVPELLSEGVEEKECYALINMALYEMELKHYPQAKCLLSQITEDGWQDISKNFWYPELWEQAKDPEGALVCVLAHVYGGCSFAGYEEMVEFVEQNYGEVAETILIV